MNEMMKNNSPIEIFEYDLEKYNFPKIIADFLETDADSLDELKINPENHDLESIDSLYKNMERTKAYENLYGGLNSDKGKRFYETFNQFVEEVIRPTYDETIYYQSKPTHRILYANSEGVSRFHRDRDYGHSTYEINYFVPQTRAFGTNTVWIESEEGKGDFTPMELVPGQFARFDGPNLLHGAKLNTSGKTRISFDFRVVKNSDLSTPDGNSQTDETYGLQKELSRNAHRFQICE